MAGVAIVCLFATRLIFFSFLGIRTIICFAGGSGQYVQRPGNGVYYRLGVRSYVELPELLKTFDVDIPQVCRSWCLGSQLPGNMRCFVHSVRYFDGLPKSKIAFVRLKCLFFCMYTRFVLQSLLSYTADWCRHSLFSVYSRPSELFDHQNDKPDRELCPTLPSPVGATVTVAACFLDHLRPEDGAGFWPTWHASV